MSTTPDTIERAESDQFRRSQKRRFRLLAGGVVAAMLVLNVAPVAANHLNVKTSDINNGAVTTPKLRDDAVKSPKINNGAITRPKVRNRAVNHAKLAANTIAARAYASVNLNGAVSRSRNIVSANVVRIGQGEYCFRGLDFEPQHLQVTVQNPNPSVATAVIGSNPGVCPAGTQFFVFTWSTTTAATVAADRAFMVTVY